MHLAQQREGRDIAAKGKNHMRGASLDITRTILHLDLDAFFCAVEELRNPSLHRKPFAVGGRPESRGVVASCSYPARFLGIHSAMPMARALRLCPSLMIVATHHASYEEISDQVIERLRRLTPLVEQISIDEAFLDVTHLTQSGESIARQLQAMVRDELGLPCSIGVASNKLVAKMATDVGKSSAQAGEPPNAIVVVPPGDEASFIAPLPIRMLWGVGPKTAQRLADLGITTIGDIGRRSEGDLAHHFGQMGPQFVRHARGLDTRPVITTHEVKSISQEVTFARDVTDGEELRRTLRDLADQVGRRVRKAHLAGITVRLKLRWSDFTTLSRQTRLPHPTNQDASISAAVIGLFKKTWKSGRAVRLLGVGLSGLGPPQSAQLFLWDDSSEKSLALQEALDTVRDRFGDEAVRRGGSVKNTE